MFVAPVAVAVVLVLCFEIQDHKIPVVQLRWIEEVVEPGKDQYLQHLAGVE